MSGLPGIIYDPAAGICWINRLTGNLPLWIKSCWQFIVKPQVSVLTSTAFPCVCAVRACVHACVHACVRACVCVCAALTIPVSHWGPYCMQAGSRYILCPSHWQRQQRTDVRRRYPEKDYSILKTHKKVSSSLQEERLERWGSGSTLLKLFSI